MEFDVCLLGNHDMASLCEPDGFNDCAKQAIQWTRTQLKTDFPTESLDDESDVRRGEFLRNLPAYGTRG